MKSDLNQYPGDNQNHVLDAFDIAFRLVCLADLKTPSHFTRAL